MGFNLFSLGKYRRLKLKISHRRAVYLYIWRIFFLGLQGLIAILVNQFLARKYIDGLNQLHPILAGIIVGFIYQKLIKLKFSGKEKYAAFSILGKYYDEFKSYFETKMDECHSHILVSCITQFANNHDLSSLLREFFKHLAARSIIKESDKISYADEAKIIKENPDLSIQDKKELLATLLITKIAP